MDVEPVGVHAEQVVVTISSGPKSAGSSIVPSQRRSAVKTAVVCCSSQVGAYSVTQMSPRSSTKCSSSDGNESATGRSSRHSSTRDRTADSRYPSSADRGSVRRRRSRRGVGHESTDESARARRPDHTHGSRSSPGRERTHDRHLPGRFARRRRPGHGRCSRCVKPPRRHRPSRRSEETFVGLPTPRMLHGWEWWED